MFGAIEWTRQIFVHSQLGRLILMLDVDFDLLQSTDLRQLILFLSFEYSKAMFSNLIIAQRLSIDLSHLRLPSYRSLNVICSNVQNVHRLENKFCSIRVR